MKLIVGLGNPGKKYNLTRHNFGWLVVDQLAKDEAWKDSTKARASYTKTELYDQTVELLKPQTFMNNSGYSVAYALKKHNLDPQDILVIYDDLDLPFGKLRIGQFESAGGHNGVKSVIQHIGTHEFVRLRMGIANEYTAKYSAEKFVLKRFNRQEKKQLPEIINTAEQAVLTYLQDGLETAMQQFN